MTLIHNSAVKTQRTSRDRTSEVIDFDSRDAKGRVVGVIIKRFVTEFAVDDSREYGYNVEPGIFFTADVQATRDGVRYGASQTDRYFHTEAEREAHIAKRIADSRKAAAKKGA